MARKDPRHTEIYKEVKRLRAKLYKAKKELNEAKGSNSRNMAQGDIDDLKSQFAWLLLDAGEYEKGFVLYRSMSWKLQGEIKYLGLGRVLTGIGRYDEAVKLLQRGLGRFPESPSLLLAMGNVYHESGDYSKSLKYFEQALAFDPEDKLILFSKANALYGLKLYEDALPVYQTLQTNILTSLYSSRKLGTAICKWAILKMHQAILNLCLAKDVQALMITMDYTGLIMTWG